MGHYGEGWESLHFVESNAGPQPHVEELQDGTLISEPVGLSDQGVKQFIIEEHLEDFLAGGEMGQP